MRIRCAYPTCPRYLRERGKNKKRKNGWQLRTEARFIGYDVPRDKGDVDTEAVRPLMNSQKRAKSVTRAVLQIGVSGYPGYHRINSLNSLTRPATTPCEQGHRGQRQSHLQGIWQCRSQSTHVKEPVRRTWIRRALARTWPCSTRVKASHCSTDGRPKCIVRVVSQVPSRYWPPESLKFGISTQ
jgi:hypothetical protein